MVILRLCLCKILQRGRGISAGFYLSWRSLTFRVGLFGHPRKASEDQLKVPYFDSPLLLPGFVTEDQPASHCGVWQLTNARSNLAGADMKRCRMLQRRSFPLRCKAEAKIESCWGEVPVVWCGVQVPGNYTNMQLGTGYWREPSEGRLALAQESVARILSLQSKAV